MENNKPAYFIFDVKIHDPVALKPYQEQVAATYKPYGGKRLVAAGKTETIEGDDPKGILVILQFDSVEKAHAWHDSPEYQALIPFRVAATDTTCWLVEGVAPAI
ncbi:DUF1330 domain-containing protein [uncultured Tolumonas sp.]|uniref:DUF1330 domain-containing protein n=1 Tax=uncultured Tolumonas sp. TaxID=263765 RepID=UPI002A0A676B|nr:DUF1330 domain-containing protein [uncultured Tolumonas sp.]